MTALLCRARSASGAAVSLLVLAGCPEPEPEVVSVSAVEYGALLFADPTALSDGAQNQVACATCHAVDPSDTRLLPGAPLGGVTERQSFWGGAETSLLRSINHCRFYFMGASGDWTGTEPEAEYVYAFLESLPGDGEAWPFTVGAVEEPGPGDAARGARVYSDACASCHGARSSGAGAQVSVADVLPEDTLAAHPPPTYDDADRRLVFVEKTRSGGFRGYGGSMPPFSTQVLSDEDLADLLSFLGVP
jgi:thiosulfate dehydrogenase